MAKSKKPDPSVLERADAAKNQVCRCPPCCRRNHRMKFHGSYEMFTTSPSATLAYNRLHFVCLITSMLCSPFLFLVTPPPPLLQLVSQYLHLGSAMKRCSVAVEAYATALNDANTNEEMLALLRAPPTGPMPSGMPGMMPFLSTKAEEEERAILAELANPGNGKGFKKRASSTGDDGEAAGDDAAAGKRKRKNKKKESDPNAPKRPPSAYLVYQNEVREQTRAENEGMKYSDILTVIGDKWKALGEAGQAKYKEKALQAMTDYKDEAEKYAAANPKPDASLGNGNDEPAAKKPKKEKKTKEDKPASTAKTSKAPTSTTTSTPAAKNAPKPAPPTSTKKNQPQATAAASSSDSDSDEEDESSASDSD